MATQSNDTGRHLWLSDYGLLFCDEIHVSATGINQVDISVSIPRDTISKDMIFPASEMAYSIQSECVIMFGGDEELWYISGALAITKTELSENTYKMNLSIYIDSMERREHEPTN